MHAISNISILPKYSPPISHLLSNIVPHQIPVRCQTHLTLASHPKHANHDDQNDPNVAKTKMKNMTTIVPAI